MPEFCESTGWQASDGSMQPCVVLGFVKKSQAFIQLIGITKNLVCQAPSQGGMKDLDMAIFLWWVGMCKNLPLVIFFKKA